MLLPAPLLRVVADESQDYKCCAAKERDKREPKTISLLPTSRSRPTAPPVCTSWNFEPCRCPDTCNFCHLCSLCSREHQAISCPSSPGRQPRSLPSLRAPSASAQNRRLDPISAHHPQDVTTTQVTDRLTITRHGHLFLGHSLLVTMPIVIIQSSKPSVVISTRYYLSACWLCSNMVLLKQKCLRMRGQEDETYTYLHRPWPRGTHVRQPTAVSVRSLGAAAAWKACQIPWAALGPHRFPSLLAAVPQYVYLPNLMVQQHVIPRGQFLRRLPHHPSPSPLNV